jgi:hypothetical protein
MAAISERKDNLAVPLERIAWLLQSLSRRQKALLLQLVPELQIIRPEEADLPAEQTDLFAYFQRKIEALPSPRAMQENDIFLGGLTVAQFFALPEPEQARLWQEAHQAVEQELGRYEHPVRPDALPAR